MPRLVACTSCRVHVKNDATECPHCGASVRTCAAFGRGAGVVLMGLTLSACPGDDATESESMASTIGSATEDASTGSTGSSTGSTSDMDTGFFESAAAYGTPDTGLSAEDSTTAVTSSSDDGTDTEVATDTETDTDTGGTTLEPDYGVPTTSGA